MGDVGNPADPATGGLYGSVNNAFSIGKYAVTVGQYAAYLNCIAATDAYNLWYPGLEVYYGIQQSGVSGA